MKRQKSSKKARDEFSDVFDALVPSVEELTDEDVANILDTAEIDADAVLLNAHQRLQHIAGSRYISQGKNVPPELKNALQQLKPASFAERLNLETSKARAAIRSVLDAAKEQVTAVVAASAPGVVQPAFRNKKELTESDQKQLAELQDELDGRNDKSTNHISDSE